MKGTHSEEKARQAAGLRLASIFFFISMIVMVFHPLNYLAFCMLNNEIGLLYQPLFAVLFIYKTYDGIFQKR